MLASQAGRRWTTLAALRAQSQTAWSKGVLLRELLAPTDAYPRRRFVKYPTAAELRDDYGAARSWAAELYSGAGEYSLETAAVGKSTIGSNNVPSAAVFNTVQDEIRFIGKSRSAVIFRDLADRLSELHPALRLWAAKRPLSLLELGDDAITAAGVALWFGANPAPGIYLRQVSLQGVHTKFIETHRRVIDEMVSVLDPGRTRTGAGFDARHGFLTAPEVVRFRLLDPEMSALGEARDLTVTASAFSTLKLDVRTVIVTENQVNFLSLPDRLGTLALFGSGYGFSALRDAEWLRRCEILYWGDLDTHGFRILDQLRAGLPDVRSLMMDAKTLLSHREFWGRESQPSSVALTRLTREEASVYEALCRGDYGPAVRLEQEHIRWDWALDQLLPADNDR